VEFEALSRLAALDKDGQLASADPERWLVGSVSNEQVLAYALQQRGVQGDPLFVPDLIIEHVGELVEVFPGIW